MSRKTIKTAMEFFQEVIHILGENQLYKTLYGELPTDKDSAVRIARMMEAHKQAYPLLDELNQFFETQSAQSKPIKEEV